MSAIVDEGGARSGRPSDTGAEEIVGAGIGRWRSAEELLRDPEPAAAREHRRLRTAARFVGAFVLGFAAVAALAAVVVFALARQYDGRVLPGVRAGAVDVSGMTDGELRVSLAAAYAGVSAGEIRVSFPMGSESIPYRDVGRAADVDAMVAAALGAGRSGDPVGDAVDLVRGMFRTRTLDVAVKVDPAALARQLEQLTIWNDLSPRDAYVISSAGGFRIATAVPGHRLAATAIASTIFDALVRSDTGSEIRAEASLVGRAPQVTDEEAEAALVAANNMLFDVTVTDGSTKYTIPAATVWRSISFGLGADGRYEPQVDQTPIKVELASIAPKVKRAAVDARIVVDKDTGRPVGVVGDRPGLVLDVAASSQAVADLLAQRASGVGPLVPVPLVVDAVAAGRTDDQLNAALPRLVKIASHTTRFIPGPSNYYGVNIRRPAAILNGMILMPGEVFNFWRAVGPVDAAHGFGPGGVIKGGKSDFTGAIGGGICSVSTTMFNAAYKGGFELLERHPHHYFITRYPVGLDATVFEGVQNMRWRNDTKYPVLIVGKSTRTTITFELWSVPTGRTVTSHTGPKLNLVYGHTTYVKTTSLAAGRQVQQEVTATGFDVTVTRKVYAGGVLIHNDTFRTHYAKMDGVVLVGVRR